MELMKNTVKIKESVLKGNTQCMCDGDVIVPDVNPDILKVLQVDAVSYINEKSVSQSRIDLSGKMNLTVLYIPDTDREKIKSLSASFDFNHRIDNSGIEEGMKAICECNVERVEFTLINSRKLRLRGIAQINYEVVKTEEKEIAFDTVPDCPGEVRKESMVLNSDVDLFETSFMVKDTIEIQSGQKSIREILKTDTVMGECEYKTVMGKVIVKGAVNVCVLYTDDNGGIDFAESELTFTEVFDCDGCSEESECSIDYEIKELMCKISEDNDGDMRLIDIELEMGACAEVRESVETEIISDCYEPGMECNIIKEDGIFEELISKPSANNTIKEIVEFKSGVPGVMAVYNVITKPVVRKTSIEDGKLFIEGIIDTYILYLSESSDSPVYSLRKEIPFNYVLDSRCSDKDAEAEVKVWVKHSGYNLNVANELELRCILAISANVVRKRKISLISEVETKPMENKNGIVIYFVQSGDTLWDIAKHYSVSMRAIEEFNGMEDESIKKGTKLFIPSA